VSNVFIVIHSQFHMPRRRTGRGGVRRHAIDATDTSRPPKKTVEHGVEGKKYMEKWCDVPGVCLGVISSASEPEERAVK
jgi:hypothetical protein